MTEGRWTRDQASLGVLQTGRRRFGTFSAGLKNFSDRLPRASAAEPFSDGELLIGHSPPPSSRSIGIMNLGEVREQNIWNQRLRGKILISKSLARPRWMEPR